MTTHILSNRLENRFLVVFIFLIPTVPVLAQEEDRLYFQGQERVGKILLNGQNPYFSLFKFSDANDTEVVKLLEVDSVLYKKAPLFQISFTLGENNYQALAKRYFKGTYDLYITWSDKFGELLIKQEGDSLVVITDFNKKLLFPFLDFSSNSGVGLNINSLRLASEKMHERNNLQFESYPASRSRGIAESIDIGMRFNQSYIQSTYRFITTDYEMKPTNINSELFMRVNGKRFFFEPVLRFNRNSNTIEGVSFSEGFQRSPKVHVENKVKRTELGADFGVYLTKSRKVQPFLKLGWYTVLSNNLQSSVLFDSSNTFTYRTRISDFSYNMSPGIGIRSELENLVFYVSMSYYQYDEKFSGSLLYESEEFSRILNRNIEVDKNFGFSGSYNEKVWRLELALAYKIFSK